MNLSPHNTQRTGLTMAEVIVFLAVGLLIAAVLIPTIQSHQTMARLIEARRQTRRIGDAVSACYRDTQLAHLFAGDHPIDVLIGPGDAPVDEGYSVMRPWHHGRTAKIGIALTQPPMCDCASEAMWDGPYLDAPVRPDPWGNRYMVNVRHLASDAPGACAAHVLSAGPNRVIDTPFAQRDTAVAIVGDDIVWRVR